MKRRRKSAKNRSTVFQKKITGWYETSARNLPWRRTRDPYRILVSEVMLQQTQVNRVLQKYGPFLRQFPTLGVLGRSSTARVIRAWRGMGYNNRAVRLRNLAQAVISDHDGTIPQDVETLRTLPGIGKYTAHAVACFAHRQAVPVVDTNVSRVLLRLFPSSRQNVWDLAERHLLRQSPYVWNQALMELGATVCTSSNPRCDACPVGTLCPSAFKHSHPRPRRPKKEPGRDGVPNRIYRGRIIEALRKQRSGSAGLGSIGKQIKRDYSAKDRTWLIGLMKKLEQDGLIRQTRIGSGILARLAP